MSGRMPPPGWEGTADHLCERPALPATLTFKRSATASAWPDRSPWRGRVAAGVPVRSVRIEAARRGESGGVLLFLVPLLWVFRAFDEALDEAWEPFLRDDG